MDCLILSDEVDCKPTLFELLSQLLVMKLRPKIILRQHLSALLAEVRHLPPFLFFTESSVRPVSGQLADLRIALEFHRNNQQFTIVSDKSGNVVSINPSSVELSHGVPHSTDTSKIFTVTNVELTRKLLPIDPPRIILLSHNRHSYLELTLNSLLFSLAPNAEKVPITLALSAPTPSVISCAKQFAEKNKSIEILHFESNTHIATPTFVLKYLENNNQLPSIFMIMEDDFILPSSTKTLYPNWPWLFANRLKTYDMMAWLPSLDNCPPTVSRYIQRHNLHISRNHVEGTRWIDSTQNYNLATSGTAIACQTELYRFAAKRSLYGYPVDNELNTLVANISCPTLLGYHIGWNQEQDGFPSLENRTWPKVPRTMSITNLTTQERATIEL